MSEIAPGAVTLSQAEVKALLDKARKMTELAKGLNEVVAGVEKRLGKLPPEMTEKAQIKESGSVL